MFKIVSITLSLYEKIRKNALDIIFLLLVDLENE